MHFVNWHSGELSENWTSFQKTKSLKIWSYQKMLFSKNVLLNWNRLMKKKWHRKLTLKVKLWHCLTTFHLSNSVHTCGEWDILLLNLTCIGFSNFSLDVSSLIVTASAFVEKKRSKMRHLKKFVKPMEINGTCIGFSNFI